jgi:hypothetical protein
MTVSKRRSGAEERQKARKTTESVAGGTDYFVREMTKPIGAHQCVWRAIADISAYAGAGED